MAPIVERVEEIPSQLLGEAPHWDIKSQSLYFVDCLGKQFCKYTPSTKSFSSIEFEKQASAVIPIEGDGNDFIMASEDELVILNWNGAKNGRYTLEHVADIKTENNNKLNDAKCDSAGRLWTGSLGTSEKPNFEDLTSTGRFYSYYAGKVTTHFDNVGISNGLAWNDHKQKFYHVDSVKGIYQFDYDINNVVLSNKQAVYTVKSKSPMLGEIPDGMTIDVDGNLWVAFFNGSKIVKIDPNRPDVFIETVKLPALQTTSLTWGGPNLDVLYVTTGRMAFNGYEAKLPEDGSIYKVSGLGTRGLPANNFSSK